MGAATPSSGADPSRAEPVWYVQAADKVWGPYRRSRLQGFVGEGRLSAQSLVASQTSGPFGPAGRRRELQGLFPIVTVPVATAPVQPSPVPESHAPAAPAMPAPAAPAASLVRPLLVWAALESLSVIRFEAALAVYGPFQAIRPGLWLVRAVMGAAPLRNALSRRLRSDDALLVVEAPLSGAAWFNLDGAAERSLRQLWGAGDPVRPRGQG